MDYKDKLKLAKEALDSGSYDKETIEYIFPELKESEDEKIRKDIIFYIKAIANNENISPDSKKECKTWIAWLEKQDGQKSTDKSGPKFNVGDWVVNKLGNIWHIDSFDGKNYQVTTTKGEHNYFPVNLQDRMHLWTIQDAKNGDVLDANGAPFIYKKNSKDYVYFYCGVNLAGDFIEVNGIDTWDSNNKVYPANKEQRNTLFAKMKEAGYEWDAENLQLTKILPVKDLSDGINIDKQKSAAWSEDDEHRIELLKALCEDKLLESVPNSTMYGEMKTTIDWLQSLRPQSKQEWSEEDEKMLDYALDMIEWYSGKDEDKSRLVSDWLKSLRPQLKHGWSEEDDWIKTKIIKVLLSYETFLNPKETNECIDWLKSLKQRIGG